ncbi:MAG TPA: type IV secretion protein IcmC, partial [Legionellaceae bacterium]|nr:type IV secretion protein IcmC [Legionellaceae bacterium]
MIDLIAMLGNLSRSLTAVQNLLGGLSYILGMVFIMVALARFRENIEQGGKGGDRRHQIHVAFGYLLAGGLMLFLPSSIQSFSNTLFGTGTSVLQYSGYQPFDIYGAMTILIETIGILWFIRGCVLVAQASHPEHGQEGSKGVGYKGLLFIIAGLFAINFHSTV